MKGLFRKSNKQKEGRIKFLILSRYRSGSNLLKESLNSIENVRVYDEAFNLVNISRDPETYLDPAYVNKVLNHPPDKTVIASGFKLMYGQAFAEELDLDYWGENINERIRKQVESIIRWLEEKNLPLSIFEHLIDQVVADKEIKVIHLVRKNQLESYLSYQLALRQEKWKGSKYDTHRSGKISIVPENLLKYFIKGESYYSFYKDLFNAHKIMDIYYEDLSSDYRKAIKKVLNFLNLPGKLVTGRPPLEKQNVCSPDYFIENYDELTNYFKNSIWKEYFTYNYQ